MANKATPSKPGWIYVLTNEAMPGIVKIGLTTRNPKDRAGELSSSSGVPLPFVVAWARAVSDCAAVESSVHRMLHDRRVSGRREAFRCDVATARQVIEAAAGGYLGRPYRPKPCKRSRTRRRGRGGDAVALSMLAGVIVLLVLLFLKPPVGWLPDPLRTVAGMIEQVGSG